MRNISTLLQEFIQSDVKQYERDLPSLTSQNLNVLMWMYDKIIDSEYEFKLCHIKYVNNSTKKNYHDIIGSDIIMTNVSYEMSSMLKYISKNISISISEKMKSKRVYNFNLNFRTITLNILFPDTDKNKINNIVYEDILKKVYIWLNIVVQFAKDKCSTHLDIYIIMTDLVKISPTNGNMILSDFNVNSAFTMSCRPINDIYVYRKEEWFKVFIHETMHAFGIDFSTSNLKNMTELNKHIKKTFHLHKEDLRLYESYCEFWAETINVLFYVFFSDTINNQKDRMSVINKINKHLFMERKWALFQCAKITNFYEISYIDIFSDDSSIVKIVNSNYKEKNTYTFSYYIVKAILFFHMGEFLDWCVDHNEDVIGFKNTRKNILSFADFISLKCKSLDMIEQIEHYEEFMNMDTRSQQIPASTKVALQTMRMSLHEIREQIHT